MAKSNVFFHEGVSVEFPYTYMNYTANVTKIGNMFNGSLIDPNGTEIDNFRFSAWDIDSIKDLFIFMVKEHMDYLLHGTIKTGFGSFDNFFSNNSQDAIAQNDINSSSTNRIHHNNKTTGIRFTDDEIANMRSVLSKLTSSNTTSKVMMQNHMSRLNEFSSDIVECFEDLLQEKNIEIPCQDQDEQNERYDDGNDAKLYGIEYWDLYDRVDSMLRNRFPATSSNVDVSCLLHKLESCEDTVSINKNEANYIAGIVEACS